MIGHIDATLECDNRTAGDRMTERSDLGRVDRPNRGRDAANPLERLVQLMHSNDRLAGELELARGRIVRARAALATPAGDTRVGALYLAVCKTKHRGILAQLRANRHEVNEILGMGEGRGRVEG
ncbi:hypothetical protein TA3x_005392 [Tundrisphaera sp. TA3]|uniref:hypothetical protein n=1 Tax=Tundrisphaera sp. TA3 TaxID=3435775 RepID=UPI003EBF5CFD